MSKILLIISAFFLLVFSGCGSSVQMVNVILQCDENCNENNAIVVKIYQLKNSEKFRHSSFESLLKNPDAALGDDLIPNSKYEKTLIPNENIQLGDLEIKKEAAYLGIMGDFYSPAKDGWQQIIPIDSDLENLTILIHENSLSSQRID